MANKATSRGTDSVWAHNLFYPDYIDNDTINLTLCLFYFSGNKQCNVVNVHSAVFSLVSFYAPSLVQSNQSSMFGTVRSKKWGVCVLSGSVCFPTAVSWDHCHCHFEAGG